MSRAAKQYEAPKLTVLGRVSELTLSDTVDKRAGPTDGLTFQGVPITNASP